MTVTNISPRIPEQTQPIKAVPAPTRPAPMNSTIYAHVRDDTPIEASRGDDDSILLSVGLHSGGTRVALFLGSDANVIRLIDALRSVYAS